MPISISPTVPSININGNTYAHVDWENNTPGTISGIANDISTQITLLESVGILSKTISGSVVLTGPESTNIGFVFTGALSANANIIFAVGFEGIAQIENQTTGGFELSCGLLTGTAVTVPALGSAAAFCDGSNFTLQSGVVRTSTGAKVTGTWVVTGTAQIGGAATVTGATVLSSTLYVAGTTLATGIVTLENNLLVGGTGGFTGFIFINEDADNLGDGSAVFGDGGTGDFRLNLTSISGKNVWLHLETDDLSRWKVGKNDTAEGGSNAGGDFDIIRHNDAGTLMGVPVRIKRSNGNVILTELPTAVDGLTGGTLWRDGTTVKVV